MKIWTNTKFKGFWPVGTAAVVIADSPEDAADYLNLFLSERGLKNCEASQFEEMPFTDGQVRILRRKLLKQFP